MTSVIEYYPDIIVTKSRGLLEYLTFGNWGQICSLDLTRRILEVRTLRLLNSNTQLYSLHEFDAVDYSYECLGAHNNVQADEFRVGLRFRNSFQVLPLAVFHGTSGPVGFESLLPESWIDGTRRTHEVESRSLANILCQKMSLELAM
jgi:hypothetical protein